MKIFTAHTYLNQRIKHQIILTFLVAGILPIIIIGSFSLGQVRRQMLKHYYSQVSADSIRVNSILFDLTTSIYTSLDPILNAKSCMKLFGSDYSTQMDTNYYTIVEQALGSFYQSTASAASIHIYTDNPNIPNSMYISSVADYTGQNWWEALQKNKWITWACLKYKTRSNNDSYNLTLIRRIGVISNQYSAYLVLSLDNNYLKNRLEQNDFDIMISIDDAPIFYSTNKNMLHKPMPMPKDFKNGFYKYTGPMVLNNEKVITNILTLQPYKTDNKFYISVNDRSAIPNLQHFTLLYIFILLITILVPTIIIILFSSYFSHRVTTLRQAMHQASLGDYNIVESFTGDDELTETFNDLKSAVRLILNKEADFYRTKLKTQKLINKQQEMEFKMLASQINPHFLNNTLETIRMQALASNNRDVATSIKLLSKSMHYVLANTGRDSTSLAEELDYIKTYLSIQKLRFGDRVNAIFHIPNDLDLTAYRILPLLLQPIVENSIIHGLESIEQNGYITTSISLTSDFLVITIEDNGIGIDSEALKALKYTIENHSPDNTTSIGLYNINKRIKLFYGDAYGIEISSLLNKGTTVTLNLPPLITHH